MKIIVWGINYHPEETGIGPYNTELCESLARRGHTVTMLTSFPYYPDWRKRPQDRWRLFGLSERAGVTVKRCWHYVPARPSAPKRMVHEASFVAASLLRGLFTQRPDVFVMISPPLPLGPAAWLLSRLKRRPYLFHVQDMQPDAALRMGMMREGWLSRSLYALERFSYKHAARATGITHGMLDMFAHKGIPENQRAYFPNWMPQPQDKHPGPPEKTFRATHGIPAGTFLAVYSGNLGKKQGLDILLDAARLLQARRTPAAGSILLIIAGNGAERAGLEQRIQHQGLDNVRLLPLQPHALYRAMLHEADICLVTQQKGSGALFFPSKLLNILAEARPVLTVADAQSELRRAVQESGCGQSVDPGRPEALADALEDLASRRNELQSMGERGRKWVEQFSREKIIDDFEQLLKTLVDEHR